MAQMTNKAPGRLELVRTFVNSRNPGTGIVEDWDPEIGAEALSDPDSARSWLVDKGLLARGSRLNASQLAELIELREALRGLLYANNGGAVPKDAIGVVNRFGSRAPVTISLSEEVETELSPAGRGVEGLIGMVLGIMVESMTSGTWSRFKVCGADDCRWAFYDHSRNRAGTWCEMATCGNRAKARSYRRRHQHS
jgi:predicted RNA-binding Zn ribbon-like protein